MLPMSLPLPLQAVPFAASCDHHPSALSRPRLAVPDSYLQDIASLDYAPLSPPYTSSPAETVEEDSISSTPSSSPNYHYVNCSFGSPTSSTEMYDNDPPSAYPTSSSPSNIYQPPVPASSNYSIGTVSDIRESDAPASYRSDSPSPADVQFSADLFHSSAEPLPQDRFPSINQPTNEPDPFVHRPSSSASLLEQRRMSEPAILTPSYPQADSANRFQYGMPYNASSRSAFTHTLQRGGSLGSLRELRHQLQHTQYQHSRSGWTSDEEPRHMPPETASFHGGDALDSPLSPFQPSFPQNMSGSPTLQYPVPEDHYGTSPSGFMPTESSDPSATSPADRRNRNSADPSSRTYSFVALPGNAVRKRPRRRYDEIERLYQCSWPDCNKSYGTLNHLNAHVTMQKHGSKRSPNEFKELRKQWRKAKKEQEAAAAASARRTSLDEREYYERHSSSASQRLPFQSPQNLPSISIPPRYVVSSDDYYSSERDDRLAEYSPTSARPRYGEATPGSQWFGLTSSTRSSLQSGYMSTSLPSHFSHGPLEPPFLSGGSADRPSPPQMMTGRLPPNSTLLTPLPGHEYRGTLPPLQAGSSMTYDPEAYYDEDSGRRSASGHASTSRGRGDEY